MSKAASPPRSVAADLGSVWLKFSILMGIAAGALAAALTWLSPGLTDRKRLPNRRQGDAVTFSHDGVTVHAAMSLDEEGEIAEVFFNAGKIGTSMDIVMRELGVVVSIALQYGAPLAVLEGALPRLLDGSAWGPLGHALALLQSPWPEARPAPGSISRPDGAAAIGEGAS